MTRGKSGRRCWGVGEWKRGRLTLLATVSTMSTMSTRWRLRVKRHHLHNNAGDDSNFWSPRAIFRHTHTADTHTHTHSRLHALWHLFIHTFSYLPSTLMIFS